MTQFPRIHVRALLARSAAGLAAVAFLGGCGSAGVGDANPDSGGAQTSPLAAAPRGVAARAERAVYALDRALRNGDVERLCRPGAVFTSAVVAVLNEGADGCEASLELSSAIRRPPALSVTSVTAEPDLATAQVRIGRGPTIPLDVVRNDRRWLVSFSDGVSPIAALQERVGSS